jgi:hypothetical protein
MMSPKMRPTAAAPPLVWDDWSSKLSIVSLPLSNSHYYRRRPYSLEAEPSEALLVEGDEPRHWRVTIPRGERAAQAQSAARSR